ncbi:ABC transporter permease [bacterium]|nr:ABC transporter permease [bacterium]MCI0606959.1 ABC transporter permease [bacterium]
MIVHSLRITLRALVKRPSFSIVVVLTFATGMGAFTAVFTVVNSILFRPLRYDRPESLVIIPSVNQDASGKMVEYGTSLSDVLDWRDRARSFSAIAAMFPTDRALTGSGDPEQVDAGQISANLFATLGVRPQIGRSFLPEEETENSNVVILSYGLWKRRFSAAPDILGVSIFIDGVPRRIVGIAPPQFYFAADAELWTPLNLAVSRDTRSPNHNLAVVARLKGGVGVEQATHEMISLSEQLAREFPQSNTGWSAKVIPVREPFVQDVRNLLLILMAAVAFLLLIVVANVSNLILVRTLEQRPELAVRIALGASRRHLLKQIFQENLILTITGGALGLLISVWSVKLMIALSPLIASSPGGHLILNDVSLDYRVIAFNLLLSIGVGFLFSLLSVLRNTATPNFSALSSGSGHATDGLQARRFQNGLVIAEIAIALLLLVGAGQMIRSFASLKRIHPGFESTNLLVSQITLPASRYDTHEKRGSFQQQLRDEIAGIPGVVSVGATTRLPLNEFAFTTIFEVEGIPAPSKEAGFVSNFRRISPSYFKTMRAPIIEGREFMEADEQRTMPVAIVSRQMAKRFWPGQSAIGKRIQRLAQTDRVWRTVVGVVEDLKDSSLSDPPGSTLYIPYAQGSFPSFHIVVRTVGDAALIAAPLRERVWKLDKNLPVYNIKLAEELFADSLSRQRFGAWLLGTFAALGLFVAIIGIYGLMSYSTARRVHEIGIRMALGAQTRSVQKMIVSQSIRLTVWGTVIGLAASAVAERLASSLWYGSGSLIIFTLIPLLLVVVSLIASLIPAMRATRIDPILALRHE